MKNVIQLQPNSSVAGMAKDQLVMAHMTLHAYYREFVQGKNSDDLEGWDVDTVVDKHNEVVNQLEQTELGHKRMGGLDDQTIDVSQGSTIDWEEELGQANNASDLLQNHSLEDVQWMFQAMDFVEMHDSSIKMEDFVKMSHKEFDELEVWQQDWAEYTFEDASKIGLTACDVNQESNIGTFLVKNSDSDYDFQIFLNDVGVYQTDSQELALSRYKDIADQVSDGKTIDQAYSNVFEEEEEEVDEVEVEQFGLVDNPTEDFKWYIWNKTEAQQWLDDNGHDDATLEHDGDYLRADITQSSDIDQQAYGNDSYSHSPTSRVVETIKQQGNGNSVISAYAENDDEDFWLCVHTVGDEYEQPDGPNMSSSLGEIGPFESGKAVLPTTITLEEEESLLDGQRFFITQHTDEDGEKGDHITDDDGNFIYAADIYRHNSSDVQDVEQLEDEIVKTPSGTYRSWKGSRAKPEDITQSNKPRRIVYDTDEDGSTEVAIEFPHTRSFAQMASEAVQMSGIGTEGELRELLGLDE